MWKREPAGPKGVNELVEVSEAMIEEPEGV